jgi:hypothetical protein
LPPWLEEPKRCESSSNAGRTVPRSATACAAEEAEFVLGAKEGQRLTVKLTSVPDKSSVFEFFAEGDIEHPHDTQFGYSGVLPMTGDYFITVKRSAGAKGVSRFRLAVTVR